MQMRPLIQRCRNGCVLAAAFSIFALTAGCQGIAPGSDRHVLVMDFETSEEGLAKYSTSLAEMLTATMANKPRVAVLERQDIRMKDFGKPTYYWQRLGRGLGADYLIVGSIAKMDENSVINARLYSCTTGEIVKGSSITRACRREDDIYPSIQAIAAVMAVNLKTLAERFDAMEMPQVQERVMEAPAVAAPQAPPQGVPSPVPTAGAGMPGLVQ